MNILHTSPATNTVSWTENGTVRTADWRSESSQKPPRDLAVVHEASAADILKRAHAQTATLWQGDFHNAKQVLAAMKKRLRQQEKTLTADTPAEIFHQHRMRQAQQSRLLNMLAVEIHPQLTLQLPRAPDVQTALLDVYGTPNDTPFLLPLNRLLGFIGAHQWHQTGVDIPALGGKIHVPFGVFSPLRGEYLDLVQQAPIKPEWQTASDIGTGSGVLAALLAKRGIHQVTATDLNPKALACASANIRRLGLSSQIEVMEADLFPPGKTDLIVCNPPWLPAKPTSAIEAALYDPDNAMLNSFLAQAASHLHPGGEVWLILSDLAEHLTLRSHTYLLQCIEQGGLTIIDTLSIRPRHAKATHSQDPLAPFRNQEVTHLYRLQAM